MERYPIGIFDSGLGGLTVLKEIERFMPKENIVYLGDTARVPYGSKSKYTIIRFSTENILFLLKKKVKIVVIACNTSSSLALDYLRRIFSIPIIGVIEAGVTKAIRLSKYRRIGIIGTKSTILSGSYQKELLKRDNKIIVYPKACPLFVPLVEEGLTKGRIVEMIVDMYLKEFKGKIDTLILGCTHYPILKKAIAQYLRGVYLVDSAKEVAKYVYNLLEERNLLNRNSGVPKKDFYVTDDPVGFKKLAKIFLKRSILTPQKINV
ncbi:MAG: glutamate racemase [Candidatus Omnitrophica bacterium]|nr:glutamate racemase [Candidatus Omnitrophota bacterium]MCM8826262.1 glutamate racemase [Candidatus Omnitrophota bacterium]